MTKARRKLSLNEITNSAILRSIEDYEKKKHRPILLSLKELKAFLIHGQKL